MKILHSTARLIKQVRENTEQRLAALAVKYTGPIVWPEDGDDAEKLYLSYVLAVFELYDLNDEVSPEAQAIARRFIAGDEHWADGRDVTSDRLWDAIFRHPDGQRKELLCRFGLFLLPAPHHTAGTREEALERLPEFIKQFGYDPTPAYQLQQSHFLYAEPAS